MSRYERWLIAKGNVFAPSAASVAKFVERLRKEKWIPSADDLGALAYEGRAASKAKATGGYAAKTVENTFGKDTAAKIEASTEAQPAAITAEWLDDPDREELRLVWPVTPTSAAPDATAVKYPLSIRPDDVASYSLEIHRALEYVYPASDQIEAIDTECNCGEELDFTWDDDEVVPAFGASTGIFAECEECSRTYDPAKFAAAITNPFDETETEVRGGAAYRFAIKIDAGSAFVRDARLAFAPELVALVENEFGRTFYEVASLS